MKKYLEYIMDSNEELGFRSKGKKLEFLASKGFDIGRKVEVLTGSGSSYFPSTVYRQEKVDVLAENIDSCERQESDAVIIRKKTGNWKVWGRK